MTLSARKRGEGVRAQRAGEVGARRSVVSPHLTPTLSAPRGGEGED